MKRGERGVHPLPADHQQKRDGGSETMRNGIDNPSGGGSLALASNDPRHDGEGFLKPKNVVTRETAIQPSVGDTWIPHTILALIKTPMFLWARRPQKPSQSSVCRGHGKDGARLDGRQSIKGVNVFSTGLKKT